MIPVAANDVAFSSHAVLLTAIALFQIAIYEVKLMFLLVWNVVLFLGGVLWVNFLFFWTWKLFCCSVEVRNCRKFRLELSRLFGWLLQFVSLLLCLIIHGFGFSTSSSMLSLPLWLIVSVTAFLTFNFAPVIDYRFVSLNALLFSFGMGSLLIVNGNAKLGILCI